MRAGCGPGEDLMRHYETWVVAVILAVFGICALSGCSSVSNRGTRRGPSPITQASAAADPWASVAPNVSTGDGVTLPPDTALPVRKGQ